jgi:hypothetical protein
MYQEYVLSLAWWWLVLAETCCQVFKPADLTHVVSLTVINCYKWNEAKQTDGKDVAVHAMIVYMGSEGTAPFILNLGA